MSAKARVESFLQTASRRRLMTYACSLGLVGLALMSWALFDQGWIPIMLAMSLGQGIGTLSFVLFLLVVVIDLRQAKFRPSIPSEPPRTQRD